MYSLNMLKRTGKSIGLMAAITVLLCSGFGAMASEDSLRGLASGMTVGVLLSAALAIVYVFRTLDARTPESRDSAATSNIDSIERQMFIGASSRAFVDSIGLAALLAALAVIGQEKFITWPVIVGFFILMAMDFSFRFLLLWRKIVDAK